MSSYIEPEEVKSPRKYWVLIDVLADEGEGEHALAIGEWNDERCLAMRWNGYRENPIGNPQSRGIPTWFIVPDAYTEVLVETLPVPKQTIAKALLGLN